MRVFVATWLVDMNGFELFYPPSTPPCRQNAGGDNVESPIRPHSNSDLLACVAVHVLQSRACVQCTSLQCVNSYFDVGLKHRSDHKNCSSTCVAALVKYFVRAYAASWNKTVVVAFQPPLCHRKCSGWWRVVAVTSFGVIQGHTMLRVLVCRQSFDV